MRRYAPARLLVGGVLLLALLPFFLLCFYNQPYLDDFAWATLYRTSGFWEAQRQLYNGMNGRFVSSLLLTAGNPLSYAGPRALGVASLGINLLTVGSLWLALHGVLRHAVGGFGKLALAAGLLLTFIAVIPDSYASLYWFASQVTHHLASLCLLLIPVSVGCFHRATSQVAKAGWLALATVGAFATGGSSELVALLLGWLLLVAGGLSLVRRAYGHAGIWVGLLLVLAAAGLLDALAPSNMHRLQPAAPDAAGILAKLAQFWQPAWLAGALRRLLLTPGTLLIGLLPLLLQPLVPALAQVRPPGLRLPLALGASVLLGGVLLGAALMQLEVADPAIASRCANVLLWWLLLGWLVACWAAVPAQPARPGRYAQVGRYGAALLLGVLVAAPVRRAWHEALVEAPRWNAQCQQRYATLQHLAATTPHVLVQFPPIRQVVPRYVLIRGYDIATEYNRPYNRDLAAYFGVDSVRVDPRARGAAF